MPPAVTEQEALPAEVGGRGLVPRIWHKNYVAESEQRRTHAHPAQGVGQRDESKQRYRVRGQRAW